MKTHMRVSNIKVGDLIYPPQREIRLWMTKALAEKELDETALIMTVVEVRNSKPDKNGHWTFVKAQYSRAWTQDYQEPEKAHYMTFLARPETPWKVVLKPDDYSQFKLVEQQAPQTEQQAPQNGTPQRDAC